MSDLQTNILYEAYPKVPLSEFYPDLLFEFEEMPQEALGNYVLRAINRLCREGNVLRREATIRVQGGVENYLLEPQDCMDVIAVMGASLTSRRGCSCNHPVVRSLTKPCRSPWGHVVWAKANEFYVSPANCGDMYEVEMSVCPTRDACEVDKILLTQHLETVLLGVRSLLYALPNKPWTAEVTSRGFNQNRAAQLESEFKLAIRRAAIETMQGQQRGAIKAQRGRVL